MSNYPKQREWANTFDHQVKIILAPHLIGISDFQTDTKRATDFVLSSERTHVGCRIRKNNYFTNERYRYQFTIRDRHGSGTPSEYQKIFAEGKPDLNFYGFACKENKKIEHWVLYDVKQLKWALVNKKVCKPSRIPNGDGTFLLPFNINDFDKNLIIAHSGYLDKLNAA